MNISTTHGLAIDHTGRWLAAVGPSDGGVFDTQTGQRRVTFAAPFGRAYDVDFAPDGASVAICFHGGHVRRYDATSGELLTIYEGHRGVPDGVRKVVFSPDGTQLASVGEDSTLRVWDVEQGQQQTMFTDRVDVNTVAWGPGDGQVIFASDAGIHLVDLHSRRGRSRDTRPIAEVQVHDGLIYSAWGDAIRIMDAQLEVLTTLPQSDVSRLRRCGDVLFAASWQGEDQGVVVWDLKTSTRLKVLSFGVSAPQVWALALEERAKRLYVGFTPKCTSGVQCFNTSTFEAVSF